MKGTDVLVALLLPLLLFAAAVVPRDQALEDLNGHAADTWNEGSYSVSFTAIECIDTQCAFQLQLVPWYARKTGIEQLVAHCTVSVPEYEHYQRYLKHRGHFASREISNPLYDSIGDCIGTIEKAFACVEKEQSK